MGPGCLKPPYQSVVSIPCFLAVFYSLAGQGPQWRFSGTVWILETDEEGQPPGRRLWAEEKRTEGNTCPHYCLLANAVMTFKKAQFIGEHLHATVTLDLLSGFIGDLNKLCLLP